MVIALHSGNTQEPLSSNGHAVVRQPGRHPSHHRQLFLQAIFHRKHCFIIALLFHALSFENSTLAITKKLKDARKKLKLRFPLQAQSQRILLQLKWGWLKVEDCFRLLTWLDLTWSTWPNLTWFDPTDLTWIDMNLTWIDLTRLVLTWPDLIFLT